jgi:two-component system, sensor histidine kinase
VNCKRALIIDDHRDSAIMLAALLRVRIAGLAVQVIHDGESGLALALAEQPDAVILDLALPGIGGAEVAMEIRRQRESDPPLLIALSGSIAEVAGYQEGSGVFDHALAKPANVDRLIKILLGQE